MTTETISIEVDQETARIGYRDGLTSTQPRRIALDAALPRHHRWHVERSMLVTMIDPRDRVSEPSLHLIDGHRRGLLRIKISPHANI